MKAIILNYINQSVDVAQVPRDADLYDFLTLELGYHIDDINFMTVPDDWQVPVYPCGCDETTATPIALL